MSLPEPLEFGAVVTSLVPVTPDARILRLRPDRGRLDFLAGQYCCLSFGGLPCRDYSLANRPDEDELEFHIRDMGSGASSYAVRQLAVDERVWLHGPLGTAVLDPDYRGPLLALAGGTGLAPMKSVVETALAAGHSGPVHLYFGARQVRDLYLIDHFQTLERRHPGFRFAVVLSDEPGPVPWRRGGVTEAALEDLPDLAGFQCHLAGPPAMVEAAVPLLLARGVVAMDIRADAFYTETDKAERARAAR